MDITVYGVALIPIVSGISRVIQMAGIPKRFIPFINLILGMGAGLIYLGEDWKKGLLIGISIGLGASGLYNGVVTIKNGNGKNSENVNNNGKESKK